MKILVMIGGISKTSINKKLFELIKPLAPSDFEFEVFDISKLPFFSQDIEENSPEIATKFRNTVSNVSAVLFITPEYNRSFPGVLKNAIDWATRPAGKNLWTGKPAAVFGASQGAIGTFGAQTQLKSVLSFLGMQIMHQPEIYFNFKANTDETGNLTTSSKEHFKSYLEKFHVWIRNTSCHPEA